METEHAKENGGTHEQKTLSTPAAAGTQAGRLPLPHNPAPEETSQRPDTPGVLQLRGRKLPCAGRWRHLRLSADDFVLRLLQVVPLGGLAAGQDAGSGDLPGQGLETLCGVRRCVRPEVQPGQILSRTAPPEFTGGRKQKVNGKGGLLWTVKSGKSLDLQGSASPQPGRLVSFIIRPGKRASNRPQNTL